MLDQLKYDELNSVPEYTSFPKTFKSYKWYKPLITGVIAAIIFFILMMAVTYLAAMIPGSGGNAALIKMSKGGYDALNAYSILGLASILSIGLAIPSLYIANKIVKDRPFSSYSSSRGGWNWKIYFKSLGIALVFYIILSIVYAILEGNKFNNQFTVLTFILALIIIPIQCIGEEFVMRGYVMQTVGSWFGIPVIAVVVQTIIFASLHPYSILGVVGVFISGIVFGIITYYTKGIEMSSAIHSANNLASFVFAGFGLSKVTTTVTINDFLIDIILLLIAFIVVFYLSKKLEWFKEENL